MTTTYVRLFTTEEYHHMANVGILHPEEKVELIEGQIISMAAKNPPQQLQNKLRIFYAIASREKQIFVFKNL